LNRQQRDQESDTVPYAPGYLPVIGHLLAIGTNPAGFFLKACSYGPLVRVRIGRHTFYMVSSLPLVREIMLSGHGPFDKGGSFVDAVVNEVGDGVATCPAEVHKPMRALLQPAFRIERIRQYVPRLTDEAVSHVSQWRAGQVINATEETLRMATAGLAGVLFADAVTRRHMEELKQNVPIVLSGLVGKALFPHLGRIPLPAMRRYGKSKNCINGAITDIIRARRTDVSAYDDLLALMLLPQAKDSGVMTEELIRGNIWQFILGGVEEPAAVMAWTMHLLVSHPDSYQRVVAEIDSVLGTRTPTYEDLDHLPALRSAIEEALRIRTPPWVTSRITSRATDLGGHRLPAGADVLVNMAALHLDPHVYPEPDHFDPDRWHPESTDQAQRNTLIPFGLGSRKCMGDVFAMTEVSVMLAVILQRWSLSEAPGSRTSPRLGFTMKPARLRLTPAFRGGPERIRSF
jgi:cytochrome P450